MRTVVKQSKPYRPLMEATDEEEIVELRNVTGTVVGFRTPLYETGIGVPGCHAHFVTEDRTQKRMLGDLLDKAFSGSAHDLVMRALSLKPASREELAAIRALLDDAERKERGS